MVAVADLKNVLGSASVRVGVCDAAITGIAFESSENRSEYANTTLSMSAPSYFGYDKKVRESIYTATLPV